MPAPITTTGEFLRSTVGVKVNIFTSEVKSLLCKHLDDHGADFTLISMEPIRPTISFNPISDLELPNETWRSRVALDLGHPHLDEFNFPMFHRFDLSLRHALYLGAPVIVIDCPQTDVACVTLATLINERLSESRTVCLLLFRIVISSRSYPYLTHSEENGDQNGYDSDSGFINNQTQIDVWQSWNNFRSHLIPDQRVGVCLKLEEDLPDSDQQLARWTGEPIRMIILDIDQFVESQNGHGQLSLGSRTRKFISRLVVSNSLMTALLISASETTNLLNHVKFLKSISKDLEQTYLDELRDWDDKIQTPLQPLSSNLDSCTYGIFELDKAKYDTYQKAMIEALKKLIERQPDPKRPFVLMVLGAGRGPLVDRFIQAIGHAKQGYKFKIYALDKNPSSVRALKYKNSHEWVCDDGVFQTEIIQSDMREWSPGVKADIIATELLGSLSDNELSPECIDGIWNISTPQTISIPQTYSSHIAPICSFRLYQELNRCKLLDKHAFDQVYVVKLRNIYHIDKSQELFTFAHTDLSLQPSQRCNKRYRSLSFKSEVNTVCHGFAGYFTADLFAGVRLSTRPQDATPNMRSWFPAFIPLEQPVILGPKDVLEVHFWRLESNSIVWYQWVVTKPIRSRIYSLNGVKTAMSKSI